MGRSYWFECSRCGYRTKVSGTADRGLNFFVQTILCRDCRELYDAVTRMKIPEEPEVKRRGLGLRRSKSPYLKRAASRPPNFQTALNRLLYLGTTDFKWLHFKLECPVSRLHRVQSWNEPDECPRCGAYLEKNALPYRIWE